jgi:hypothetical protein
MESSDYGWVGEIFTHLEVLVCICWWYWSLLCLYILITHIVSDSYSRFSFCYVGFLCNMEVAHRWCEFLKYYFLKTVFFFVEIWNLCHTAENFKNLFITLAEFIICFCASTPMKAVFNILLNIFCYFMANVSNLYTYSLLTYPLAGLDITLPKI